MAEELRATEQIFLNDIGFRQSFLASIRTNRETLDRMGDSLRDSECYNGKIHDYLVQELKCRYSKETVNEMPKISQINLTKKIANKRGSLYSNEPERKFHEMTDDQIEKTELVYADLGMTERMKRSNRFYELQRQNHILFSPKNGKIVGMPLAGHRLNVLPSACDPEQGEVYVISTFDETMGNQKEISSDGINQVEGDPDDYKASLEHHVVWSPNTHYTMNGRGEITSFETVNEIAPLIPIVEVSDEKDGKYWVDSGSEISRFGIEFCAQISNWAHIVNLQSYSQAILKGPEDLMPSTVKIGPNYILRLITNPDENKDISFEYLSPNSDLAGVKDLVLTLLALFQSSEEVDPTTITGEATAQRFGSGVERLLSMIENFKPSKEAMSLYEQAEMQAFSIITAWMNKLKGSDALDEKYQTQLFTGKESMSIKYKGPENVLSETEELDIVDRRMENGTLSRIGAIARLDNVSRDEAKNLVSEIDDDDFSFKKKTDDQDDQSDNGESDGDDESMDS